MYLHVEYMDGTKHTQYIGDSTHSVAEGVLRVYGGDGSYRNRGTTESFVLANIKRFWTDEEREP